VETERFFFSASAIPDANISAWELEIHQLVYTLYGLTSDEVALVVAGGQ
jgi:hypothetical protein